MYYSKLFNIDLIEVLSKDLFSNIKPKIGSYIINLEDSEYGGSHWTTVILKHNIVLYYDSFSMPMPQIIIQFIKRFDKKVKIIYSIDQIQHIKSVYCGWFALWFIIFINVIHKKDTNYRYLLNKHNSMFDLDDKRSNDIKLKKYVKNHIDKYKIKYINA